MPELLDIKIDDVIQPPTKVGKKPLERRDGMKTSEDYIKADYAHNASYYRPVPVVLSRGEGIYAYDVEGERYMDFASAQGALNFGHCHPKIVAEVIDQLQKITIPSRSFHSDMLSIFSKEATEFFGYDKIAPMNSGVEAGETAIKLARKWGYDKKNIPPGRAEVITCRRGFFGRSIAAISASTDPAMYTGYGPLLSGYTLIPYDDTEALESALKGNPYICAFYVEPIQGEAGVYVPAEGYLKACELLCKKYNVLFICDEVQTGMGRTGEILCCHHDGARPDIVVLGKSFSGGLIPVSGVLADDEVMNCFTANSHGGTFGGNALGCRAAIAAMRVLKEERLAENAKRLGTLLMRRLELLRERYPWIIDVRGKGLISAFEVAHDYPVSAASICERMKLRNVLCKQTHVYSIRLAPPLVITEAQLNEGLNCLEAVLEEVNDPAYTGN